MSRAGASPATSTISRPLPANNRRLRSESSNQKNSVLSLEHNSTICPSTRETSTIPSTSSATNAVVRLKRDPRFSQSLKITRASSGLRRVWGSNFDSILDEHERISSEVDSLLAAEAQQAAKRNPSVAPPLRALRARLNEPDKNCNAQSAKRKPLLGSSASSRKRS